MVFLWIMGPYIVFMNLLIFGSCLISSIPCFLKAFGFSAIYFFIIYAIFGSVAVLIKSKYSTAGDLFRRVRFMLPVFYVMNIGAIHGAYAVYHHFHLITCPPLEGMLWWAILYGCIMSTVITFINEGMASWENWKNSLSESEKLRNAYQRSKLLGLKGQINPHFLFNCFNALSGLIQEDEKQADAFLDEMIKVHRYLLRSDDEYLVTLEDELKFAQSYLHLTQARFGSAIETHFDVPQRMMDLHLPPLTMQVILENMIYANALSKRDPLIIHIKGVAPDRLTITHSLHEKTIVQDMHMEEGLDNLITKYRLLSHVDVSISEKPDHREITLPLFESKIPAA